MKLTNKAIDNIYENRDLRFELAMELDRSEESIRKYARDNEDNGDLTKAAAIKIISEKTGLKTEEILEELQPQNNHFGI